MTSTQSAWLIGVYGAAAMALIYALARAIQKRLHDSVEAKAAADAAAALAAEPAPPTIIVSTPDAHGNVVTERAKRGLCIYCENRAAHHLPRLKVVRSKFDFLLRYVGVKPMDRWRVVLWDNFDSLLLVCDHHREWVRGLLENKATELAAKYARFSVACQLEVTEFEQHVLHAEIRNATLDMTQKHAAVAPVKRGRNVTLLSDAKKNAPTGT